MLAAVVAYFVIACGLGAWLLFPSLRAGMLARVFVWCRRFDMACGRFGQDVSTSLKQATHSVRRATTLVRSRWLVIAVAAGLLFVPPLIVLLRGWGNAIGDTDLSSGSQSDAVVTALLKGEQLIPPPPLPPDVFTTAEVESVRPRLRDADRRWDLLDSDFRQRLLLAYRLMREEHGYDMVLIEGYRTPQRQAILAAMGPQVSNAAAWQSYHQYGLAADSAFVRAGRLVITERDPWAKRGYELFGTVARRAGLTWGGHWHNADLGHVELRKPMNGVSPGNLATAVSR